MRRKFLAASLAVSVAAGIGGTAALVQAEPLAIPFPEAKHGAGELKYVAGVPVLVARGTPAEMGEQIGVLGLRPMAEKVRETLTGWSKRQNFKQGWPKLVAAAKKLEPRIPADHRAELDAAAKAAGIDRETMIVANTVGDLMKLGEMVDLGACSTFVVEPARSATGGPLFGRNLDIPPFDDLVGRTTVTVYRPTGKHAFASVGVPGLVGAASCMNEKGLAITLNEIGFSGDGAPKHDPTGVPMALLIRRLAEECATVEEAVALLKKTPRATMFLLTLCDRERAAVCELTPRSVGVRSGEEGLCYATNHFRTDGLKTNTGCWRFTKLAARQQGRPFTREDVTAALHAVNQGAATVQHMVFEPAALKLHLAYGRGPVTKDQVATLELGSLFRSS